MKLLYGKNEIESVVSVEHHGDKAVLFIEKHGLVTTREMPARYWALYNKPVNNQCVRLDGDLHYKWQLDFTSKDAYNKQLQADRMAKRDFWKAHNDKESYMLRSGVGYYKGMTLDDVSVMSFDIETNGLLLNADSTIFCISTAFQVNGKRETQVFEDVEEWVNYVQKMNPSIMLGHNIFSFDLPYLNHVARYLKLGRNGSPLRFSTYPSRVRKDQSQTYEYFNAQCYGREIVDTFHLALKVGPFKGYDDYSIKTIAKHEDIAKENRQYYDASQIGKLWNNPFEKEKIKQYAMDDAEEALDYFYKVAPAYFYYAQQVPKSFQQIISGATGAQVNSILVRSYIQDRHSIPKETPVEAFEGAISKGNPGLYSDVKKVDVASLYPSIMLQYSIYDEFKDPKGNMLAILKNLTEGRLANKKKAKETGSKLYSDLEQSQKIIINSMYGFLGAKGLNFNSNEKAALVTELGRKVLNAGIDWATERGFTLVNMDTDSFSYCGGSRDSFAEEIVDLNSRFPELIRWENDGLYDKVLIVKAKNYVLKTGSKIKIKGSALKATTKEKALQQFIREVIELLLNDDPLAVKKLYNSYAAQIARLDKIDNWCTKKTVTDKVLTSDRTNEARVRAAIEGSNYREGDKVYVFFDTQTSLCLRENFKGEVYKKALYKKLYDTLKVFAPVIDLTSFSNFALKRHEKDLLKFGSLDSLEKSLCTQTASADQLPLSFSKDVAKLG